MPGVYENRFNPIIDTFSESFSQRKIKDMRLYGASFQVIGVCRDTFYRLLRRGPLAHSDMPTTPAFDSMDAYSSRVTRARKRVPEY